MDDLATETKKLSEILLKEQKDANLADKGEKLKLILRLLGAETLLTLTSVIPGRGNIWRSIDPLGLQNADWKIFNTTYLRRTLAKLEKEKAIDIFNKNGNQVVVLTDKGCKKVLEGSVEEMVINKPPVWDHKWRIVLYDIFDKKKNIRDHFRKCLTSAGFFEIQKSVYIHAYPCEKEIEYLKTYLGLAGEVKVIIAEKIEDDDKFRSYFDV
ncbi:MAG: CRISPR-associated endonuclease Cas2 [Patescibacteria group bacterium]